MRGFIDLLMRFWGGVEVVVVVIRETTRGMIEVDVVVVEEEVGEDVAVVEGIRETGLRTTLITTVRQTT
jgi:hypothetical protein